MFWFQVFSRFNAENGPKNKWPIHTNKFTEILKFPVIWPEYYLRQTLNSYILLKTIKAP